MTLRSEEVTFYSQGSPVWGKLHIPDDCQPGQKRGAWIILGGFHGVYNYLGVHEDSARRLVKAGYIAFGFEPRTFGRSTLPWIPAPLADPFMQCEDISNALTYLQCRGEVDEARIGLIGFSFGAFTGPYAAAFDSRVAAVVSINTIGDGYRWLRGQRTAEEWDHFIKELEENRKQRVLTGKGRIVQRYHIYNLQGPHREVSIVEARKVAVPDGFLLEAAESILRFKPEEYVHRISPRPVLYVSSPKDYVTPVEEAISMYEKTRDPKTLWLIPNSFYGKDHYELHEGGGEADLDKPTKWKTVFENILAWMHDNMSSEVRDSAGDYCPPKLRVGYATRNLEEQSWLRRDAV